MEQKLIQSMSQTKKMTQSLMQSIQLLQLNGTELIDYVKGVMEENPLIEGIEPDFDYVPTKTNVAQLDGSLDFAQVKVYSMYDLLKEQVGLLQIDKQMQDCVIYGIDSLDENGYLSIDLEEWSTGYGCSIKLVEDGLRVIQSLDPPGIGARNLQECLVLQVRTDREDATILVELITEHLDLVANQDRDFIKDLYNIETEEVERILKKVKSCNPKPGQQLSEYKAPYIIPDAEIRKEMNEWKIIINKWNYPTIHVNDMYQQFKNHSKDTNDFLREKHKQVQWLLYSINYRKLKMEQVLQLLLTEQYSFFEVGPFSLKPLKLQDLADQLNVHISTVSRMFKNKYVQTPYGIFPFHFFLQTGIVNTQGQMSSTYSIKQTIQNIITEEDKSAPLSDESIRKVIANTHNIAVSRRTIAKYRAAMKISGSSTRKKQSE